MPDSFGVTVILGLGLRLWIRVYIKPLIYDVNPSQLGDSHSHVTCVYGYCVTRLFHRRSRATASERALVRASSARPSGAFRRSSVVARSIIGFT